MRGNEEITVVRDVEATLIPAGNKVMIPEGVSVTLTQALGGSYTVVTPHGFLARIEGKDADALGKTAPPATEGEPASSGAAPGSSGIEAAVWEQLRLIYDPEIPINIVDLGLIYACRIHPEGDGARVEIEMTMTAPGCGMGDVLRAEAEDRIGRIPGVSGTRVDIVWDPPWDQSRMSEAARLELGFG
jgi:probable FeS assembly SUF system protein SufT